MSFIALKSATSAVKLDKRYNKSLILILLVSVAVNIPYFFNNYFPVHDTLSVFQFFSYYYSEIYSSKELPWWLPYTAYGMPIESYILFSLGPFQYLTLIVGYCLNLHNTLMLFSLSLVGDTIFLAYGAYVFCRHIMQNRRVATICVISLLLLIQYDRQIYWNFKILLPIPICLYLGQKAVEKLNPTYLLIIGATLLIWSFGSLPYVLPVQFYTIFFYCLFLMLFRAYNTDNKRDCNQNKSFTIAKSIGSLYNSLQFTCRGLCTASMDAGDQTRDVGFGVNYKQAIIALIAIAVIIFAGYLFYEIHSIMLHEMAYNTVAGRGDNFKVDINNFLTYGGNLEYIKIFELFNGIPNSANHDFLAYVGLINIIFVIYGFVKQRNSSQYALGLVTLLIILFTTPDLGLAKLAYYLPGMFLVRHIAYFIVLAKLCLIMLSGFGIHAYLHNNRSLCKLAAEKGAIFIPLIVVIICLVITKLYNPANNAYTAHATTTASIAIFFLIVAGLLSLKPRLLCAGLVLISLYEIFSYRMLIYDKADLFLVPFTKEFKHTRSTQYQPSRVNLSQAKFITFKPLDMYGIGSSYLQEDLCPAPRQDIIAAGVKKLFALRRDVKITNPKSALDPGTDTILSQAIGCSGPKIRLVERVQYADKKDKVISLMQQDIYNFPVIYSHFEPHPAENTRATSMASPIKFYESLPTKVFSVKSYFNIPYKDYELDTIKIDSFSANKISMTVNNQAPYTQWLIYADAINHRWHATVDNMPQDIFPANIAFKAIQIKPGIHKVSFMYTHGSLIFISFTIMLAGIAVTVLYIIGQDAIRSKNIL